MLWGGGVPKFDNEVAYMKIYSHMNKIFILKKILSFWKTNKIEKCTI